MTVETVVYSRIILCVLDDTGFVGCYQMDALSGNIILRILCEQVCDGCLIVIGGSVVDSLNAGDNGLGSVCLFFCFAFVCDGCCVALVELGKEFLGAVLKLELVGELLGDDCLSTTAVATM